MMKPGDISRRVLLSGLWLLGSAAAGWTQVRKKGNDQGLGGTGISGGQDQGLGGTGIVGVIQRFGSIVVNGERVSYAANVPVRIDGEPATAAALRIGQVARVRAERQANGTLTTRAIDISSEVAGPIQAVKPGEFTVLGQTVISTEQGPWRRVGAEVSVFGLRRTDGTVVASLVAARRAGAARVRGVLTRDASGGLRIGALPVTGADPALAGRRVQLEGRAVQGTLQVARAKADDLSDLAGVSRLLIEGYVRHAGDGLQIGAGYAIRDGSKLRPADGEARVVIDAVPDSSGGLRVESIRAVGRYPGSSMQDPRGPDRPPGADGSRGGGSPGSGGPGGAGHPGGMPADAPGSAPPGGLTSPGSPMPGPGDPGPGGGGFGGGGGPGGGGPPRR